MGVLASVLVGYIPAPRLWFVSKSCHVSRARACTLLGKMAAATPSPLKRPRRAVANEAPPVPDVGPAKDNPGSDDDPHRRAQWYEPGMAEKGYTS